ncbi:hypothetical protein KSU1_C0174 [Candidatus Jettenia caeni]|uniref:Uncharacterized protein n=1 Tax=Candidatus Jettenia caeni TaxID=247490 RepID=I3IJ75_9BACT|nr:hypothetical protein KSU1_C0174 [Candidatus Jettenia caeni]
MVNIDHDTGGYEVYKTSSPPHTVWFSIVDHYICPYTIRFHPVKSFFQKEYHQFYVTYLTYDYYSFTISEL